MLNIVASAVAGLNVVDAGAFSVAKLLPIENKDSFFSAPPRYYGVFDGVSQCPQSRPYSRAVAKVSMEALLSSGTDNGDWTMRAQSALGKAASAAQTYSGASTAILLDLDLDREEPRLCWYAVGDCQCMVVRASEEQPGAQTVAYYSDVQFHTNGAPYQLAGEGYVSDAISDGQSGEFALAAGDTVLCFSDGFANNFDLDGVARGVGACSSMTAEELATKLTTEAQKRGIVEDDVTVVALRIGEGKWVGGDMSPVTSADGGFDLVTALADVQGKFDPWKAFKGAVSKLPR